MYAIVEEGGNQYKVREGDLIRIERKMLAPGEKFEFENVLAFVDEKGLRTGADAAGIKVTAELVDEAKGKKVSIMKFRRRKDSQTHKGHRQKYALVRIEKISIGT
jgi:large subunit ribosomal protein L21